jgi:hypothetical protein
MSQDPVDANKASAAIDRVVAARGDLTRAGSQMSLKRRRTESQPAYSLICRSHKCRSLRSNPSKQDCLSGTVAIDCVTVILFPTAKVKIRAGNKIAIMN